MDGAPWMSDLIYLAVGIMRRWLPNTVLYTVMGLRGDNSIMERPARAIVEQIEFQLRTTNVDLHGKHVLDLGSGRYARGALGLLAAGADRVTLVDFDALPLDHPKHREMLIDDCAVLGLDPTDALARIRVCWRFS
jgi:hypothetical protein